MEIITALGSNEMCEEIRKNRIANVFYKDIQYQEAVIDILDKNKNIELLILSEILPGELNIKEFINIIKFNNPNLEIIIFLEKENYELERFLISKGINNIYYNNQITIKEILEKIKKTNNIYFNKNKNEKINLINNNIYKIKNNKNNYLKKIIKNIINKKNNKKINKNKKIIGIFGANKIGKSIFTLIFCYNLKNKKILIVDFYEEKNNIKKIIGKIKNNKINNKINIYNCKKNIDIMFVKEEIFFTKIFQKNTEISKNIINGFEKYDYIFIEIRDIKENGKFIKNFDKIILLVEANLLGINETRDILENIVNKQKYQKDNIKIVFNKHEITSIREKILKKIFEDFEILGHIQYDKFYNILVNNNLKIIPQKIKNNYLKIIQNFEKILI